MLTLPPGSKPHFFSSSGGNAGAAAAEACHRYGYPCTVAVPETAAPHMVSRLREEYGATVIQYGKVWRDADDKLREIMSTYDNETDVAVYCHPYDNQLVFEGHSTMVDEIVDQAVAMGYSAESIKAVSCSVGGGGLFSGIALGLQRRYKELKPMIVAVETTGANKLYQSLQKGEKVSLSSISTIASSLGANEVANKAWQLAQDYPTLGVEVSDKDSVSACLRLLNEHRIMIEPACGAALAPWYNVDKYKVLDKVKLTKDDAVVLVVCGGMRFILLGF